MGVINTPGPWSLKHKRAARSVPLGTGTLPIWKRSTSSRQRMYDGNYALWHGQPQRSQLKRLQDAADRYAWEFEPPATALDAAEAYIAIMCGAHGRDYTPLGWWKS